MRRVSLALIALAIGQSALATDAAPATAAPAAAPQVAAIPAPAPAQVTAELYEVFAKDGRVYRFYDFADYQNYLKIGETPYRLTQLGAGPNGETVVYDLAKADKEKTGGFPSVELVAGNLKPDVFYGEMIRDGRIYVFDNAADMALVRQTNSANLRYTDIGGGPNGETVIYVLNAGNKEKKPEALIAAFRAKHGS